MSGTMLPYIVRQGDYLAKLSFVHGFDADDVWNDPKNEDLKKLRTDPNILAPGDILFIPEKEGEEGLPIAKGTENSYAATVPKVEVKLTFQDSEAKPMAGAPCQIRGLGDGGADMIPTETDGDGTLTLKVPVTVREVEVHFPRQNTTHHVRVGDMDPANEASGIQKRLQNLGFWHGAGDKAGDLDALLGSAIMTFQGKMGIEGNGAFDPDTEKAVLDQHKL
jgi:hypothetical protein